MVAMEIYGYYEKSVVAVEVNGKSVFLDSFQEHFGSGLTILAYKYRRS
jgi:hypothetical protein